MNDLYTGRKISGKENIEEGYIQYLEDESRMRPDRPEVIYFPVNTEETAAAVRECRKRGYKITLSGGRTGIVGGAVARNSQAVISTEDISHPLAVSYDRHRSVWSAAAGAGMKLFELNDALKHGNFTDLPDSSGTPGKSASKKNLFFPVDPTETNASLGGMAAANASGARTLYYGATRDWIIGITAVLADGTILDIPRGKYTSKESIIDVAGNNLAVPVQPVSLPATKHAAGYRLEERTDLIDLFIGSEGTLGIITELKLKLTAPPPQTLYLCMFLSGDEPAGLVHRLKTCGTFTPISLEYMDNRSVSLLREFRSEQHEASGVPELPDHTRAVLYTEIGFSGKTEFMMIASELKAVLASQSAAMESTWAGFSPKDIDAMKKFRHALPERINSIIAERKRKIPELTKIGTDMAVPDEHLHEMLTLYETELSESGMTFCKFGHIGNGHIHVNILPRDTDEQAAAWRTYKTFAERAVSFGGSVTAEHGIGKLKKKYLSIQYTEDELNSMKAVKHALDPENIFNPDVLFSISRDKTEEL